MDHVTGGSGNATTGDGGGTHRQRASPRRPIRFDLRRPIEPPSGDCANHAPFRYPTEGECNEESNGDRGLRRSRSAAAAVAAAFTIGPGAGSASSHREAPLIAEDPWADLTDVYAFRSPDKPNTVTLLANVIPGEDPAAGPNWYTFSPGARYNLKIDTNGDVKPDVIYRFQFQRKTGPFFLGDTAQPFTVTRIAGGKTTVVAKGTTPPNNIGPRSTPNYHSLVTKSIASFAGGASKAFAGQRDDPFFGDIGAIFDLVAIRKGTGNAGGGKDFFAGYGVHTYRRAGADRRPQGQERHDRRLGVGRAQEGRRRAAPKTRDSGNWVQVNRLGNPLVNEVIIPTGLKDLWNAYQPWNESDVQEVLRDARSSPR